MLQWAVLRLLGLVVAVFPEGLCVVAMLQWAVLRLLVLVIPELPET
jgi:hypothetical protein